MEKPNQTIQGCRKTNYPHFKSFKSRKLIPNMQWSQTDGNHTSGLVSVYPGSQICLSALPLCLLRQLQLPPVEYFTGLIVCSATANQLHLTSESFRAADHPQRVPQEIPILQEAFLLLPWKMVILVSTIFGQNHPEHTRNSLMDELSFIHPQRAYTMSNDTFQDPPGRIHARSTNRNLLKTATPRLRRCPNDSWSLALRLPSH